MPSRLARLLYVPVFVLLSVLAYPHQALAGPPTPTQPILIVQDSASSDPYQYFAPELLTTEGLNGFQTAQLSDLTASFLSNYDVVILPHLALTSAQAVLFQNYVNAGGNLIGFRPDQQLATTFGVNPQGTTLSEGWLKIDSTTPYGAALVAQAVKFHGTADNYSLVTAKSLATLYATVTTPTSSPAATVNTYGLGQALLFAFDLTQSIVLLRQGNPAWAGYPNNHDGFNTMRPSQMFMDKGSGQFWNDLGDGSLYDVPQADEELRLFSNVLTLMNAGKRPLPRLWYFPNQARALVLMTGDQHGDASSNSSNEISTVQSYGGLFDDYLWYPYGSISSATVQSWQAAGHGFGVHFDDTAQADSSGIGGSAANWAGMQSVMSTALGALSSTFPTVPNPPISNRNHWLIWVSNNSAGMPDQTANAKLLQNFGIQMDTSFVAFPNRWGYMNGSGLPMKFLDTATGTVIPVYEQSTQYEDDVQLGNTAPSSLNWALSTAQAHYQKSISDSLNKFNTVITFNFHPDSWSNYSSFAQTVLQYARSNGVPMWSADNWNSFWNARSATSISMPSFTSNALSFTVSGSTAGLSLLIPEQSGSSVVSAIQVDGASQSFSVQSLQGILYAGLVLTSGAHNISATYASGANISGAISPSVAASSSTVAIQGGPGGGVAQTVTPAADGSYTFGPLPAGTYSVTPGSGGYTFTPASSNVVLGNSNITGLNFSGSSVFAETIFTTQTPASTATDANYELGTVFQSAVTGHVTAIRFWKASGETGTHTGRLWSSSGQLLASVTFSGETASGWQQQNLTAPVAIAANTSYVVSVNTGNNHYVATSSGLVFSVVNGDLSTIVGNDGLYGTSGTFPSSSYQNANYFRDIVFVPGATYGASGSISPSTSGAGATLTLSGASAGTATADSSGNFSFSGLVNGTYSVTPSKSGYTFSPASQSFTVTGANVTGLSFTATVVPTYSISGTISPTTAGSGATVTLSGAASATVTADSSGNFSFAGLNSGTYTVTPSKAAYTFTPSSQSVTVNGANVTGINFSGVASGETIFTTQTPGITNTSDGSGVNYELGAVFQSAVTGQITALRFWKASSESGTHTGRLWSSTGQLLATVTFSGETASGWQQQNLTAPVAIAANTSYVVSVNTGNTYYVVTGGGLASSVVNGDLSTIVGNNGVFATTPGQFPNGSYNHGNYFRDVVFYPGATYGASGSISPSTSGAGATLTLSGASAGTATADSSGNFSFSGLVNGTYSVTPSKSGYTFSPASQSFTVTGANVTGLSFTATVVPTYSISGTISPTTAGSGATVTLSGAASATVTADSSGNFSFAGLNSGTYTVTPSKAAYTFTPSSQSVTVNGANVTGINFSGVASGETIFTTQTPGITNTSDGSGVNYELGAVFQSAVTGQITALRFWKASSESGTHTGRLWSSTGQLLATVTFSGETASGWQQQNLTAPVAIAANTSYVVSVNTGNTYYVVTGGGLASSVVNGDLSTIVGNNGVFATTPGQFPNGSYNHGNYFRDVVFYPGATYGASGSISPSTSGAGATLTLSGASAGTATADSSGNFSFSGLVNGTYSVTPSKSGYTFSPASQSFTVTGANVTGLSFTATVVPTYSISGTISPTTAGSGATVTLSGAASATVTADSSGNFSFAGLNSGTYTVTPSKAAYTFTPPSQSVTVNGVNVTGINFSGVASGETIFTTQAPAITGGNDGTGYELGTVFVSGVSGQITAVRFWKDANETGTHTGKIWSATGQLLASVTFSGETASGWQQQNLTVALSISANTQYVVSVNTGNNYYVATGGGLASSVVNGDLSTVVGSNGVFGSPGQFPNSSYNHGNYFRDVVFVP